MAKFKTFKFLIVVLTFSFLFLSCFPCYAEEQYINIAESFGLCSKGIKYYRKGKLFEAKEILEKAIELDSRNEEAQGYLKLVNAELRMREEGRLDSYQNSEKLRRERDFNKGGLYANREK